VRAVLEEPGYRAQRAQLFGIRVRARVAGTDDERRRHGGVHPEHCLAAQVTRSARGDVAKAAKGLANAVPAVPEPTAHDAVERVQAELQPRRHAEVAAPTS
jgi:hypothetical protein